MRSHDELLQTCEELKQKIKDLQAEPVDRNYKTIYEIQLKHLQNRLSDVGRQLKNLNMYRENEHD